MGTREKLIERFCSLPTDFTFQELERLLSGFGYVKQNKGATSGSRVIFKDVDNHFIMVHKPHPGNILKAYAMRQIHKELQDKGHIK